MRRASIKINLQWPRSVPKAIQTAQNQSELAPSSHTAVPTASGEVSKVRSFDPNAEETVFFPRLVGG
jgi:hypothetical protein